MPLLELGPYTFEGKYEDAIGTSVFFEELTAPGELSNHIATNDVLFFHVHRIDNKYLKKKQL